MLPGIDGLATCRRLRADGVGHADPHAHRARRGRATAWPGWTPAPTTTWSSRSRSPSCSRGCARSRAAHRRRRGRRSWRPGRCGSTRRHDGSGATAAEVELTPREFAILEVLHRAARRRDLTLRAARARLGRRVRAPLQRDRRGRRPAAREDRPASGRTRSRQCAASATGWPREPARTRHARLHGGARCWCWRAPAAFIAVRSAHELRRTQDRGLRERAAQLGAAVAARRRGPRGSRTRRGSRRTRTSPRWWVRTGSVAGGERARHATTAHAGAAARRAAGAALPRPARRRAARRGPPPAGDPGERGGARDRRLARRGRRGAAQPDRGRGGGAQRRAAGRARSGRGCWRAPSCARSARRSRASSASWPTRATSCARRSRC